MPLSRARSRILLERALPIPTAVRATPSTRLEPLQDWVCNPIFARSERRSADASALLLFRPHADFVILKAHKAPLMLPIPPAQLKQRLVKENLVTPERFDALAAEATSKGQNLTDILISEKVADDSYLNSIFAGFLGVEIAALGTRGIDENTLKLLPEEMARERQVILFGQEPDGTLVVAMADPSDLATVEYLEQRLQRRLKPFLATAD